MFNIIKEVRDLKRFNEILKVLFEEGFDFLLVKTGLLAKVPFTKRITKRLKEKNDLKPEVMLRKTLERLGPTFIKFGQLLSVRPDLVPKEYAKELEKLQDKVQPFPYGEAKSIIEKELGKGLEHLFLDFDKTPVASASISQVHKATLKSGEKVAVKVQRPNVKEIMETDIEIMAYIAKLLENNIEAIKRFKQIGRAHF